MWITLEFIWPFIVFKVMSLQTYVCAHKMSRLTRHTCSHQTLLFICNTLLVENEKSELNSFIGFSLDFKVIWRTLVRGRERSGSTTGWTANKVNLTFLLLKINLKLRHHINAHIAIACLRTLKETKKKKSSVVLILGSTARFGGTAY